MNSVPVSAFSGLPPSDGGLKLGSRHVPVQVRTGIDLCEGERLLVADQRAIGRIGSVDAVFPASLPEHLVAAEECQVHAGIPRRLNTGALLVPTSIRRAPSPCRSCGS